MKIGPGHHQVDASSDRSSLKTSSNEASASYQFKPVHSGPGHKKIPAPSGDLDSKDLGQYSIKPESGTAKLLDLEDFAEPEPTLIVGLEMVNAHPKQGLPRDYLTRFMKSCSKRQMPFFSRFVEPVSKSLIARAWPTKNYMIKTKSANSGLPAGTIPSDQKYSKKAGDPKKVARLNQLTQKCLKSTWKDGRRVAVSIPLKLDFERIEELESQGYVFDREEMRDEQGKLLALRFKAFEGNNPKGKIQIQEAWLEEDDEWAIYEGPDRKSSIEVLAKPSEKEGAKALPYTADVDPLLEAFPLSDLDLGGKDKLPLPLISDVIVRKQVETYKNRLKSQFMEDTITAEQFVMKLSHYHDLEKELLKDFFTGITADGEHFEKEDPEMGNVTQRTRNMVSHYKRELQTQEDVVHHNVDAHSLATDESANYPVTAFFPESMGIHDGICMIFNEQQLLDVMFELMEAGYEPEKNLLWGKTRARRPSFNQALHHLEGKTLSQQQKDKQLGEEIEKYWDSGISSESNELEEEVMDFLLQASVQQQTEIEMAMRKLSLSSQGSEGNLSSSDSAIELDSDDDLISSDSAISLESEDEELSISTSSLRSTKHRPSLDSISEENDPGYGSDSEPEDLHDNLTREQLRARENLRSSGQSGQEISDE
ncbi:anthrax toxin-like adenylyl cyclase domain-containing protein [Endozoicomonas numazuensis]|uniref:Anthrax toxin edema factor central domain-containing protein n=1 Tax=Endozoicomonas numazuensis TaxID=1137799 RepID=A0A081NIK2_9GAMM|nr:anthrax toxin-like adenylyl cyclase domain-containing protein [Endozoicomonas numazuensis]KEQ18275.1 hypothetical protein GZ78_12175 [Endozoicomonas numazuensis]